MNKVFNTQISKSLEKLWFYVWNFCCYFMPDICLRWRAEGLLRSLSSSERDYALQRAEYYCRLPQASELPATAIRVGDFCYPWHSNHKYVTYFFDLYQTIRCFPKQLRFVRLFGDVNCEQAVPTFVKSRPIIPTGCYSMCVLLKLNKIRHFHFVKDKLSFSQKKDMLVSRTTWAQPSQKRTLLNKMFLNHPMCNVGKTRYEENEEFPESVKGYLTISQQLEYKFIACIEGTDVATNLKWVMSSNSIAVMPRPQFETWFMEGKLRPNYHYIEVKSDYSDLIEKIKYYCIHHDEAQAIIDNAHEYISQFRNNRMEKIVQLTVAQKYFEITNHYNHATGRE